MNIDEFRCMRRGIQLFTLNKQNFSLIAPIEKRSDKTERALFLIHGFSSTPAVFRILEPTLANYYDAVFCPVLLGHAENMDAFAETKAKAWLLQVEEIFENLANQFAEVEVMGLSLGGLLACHLSKRYNLAHLYLLAPALDLFLPLNHSIKLAKALNWLGFRKIRSAAGNLYSPEHFEIAYRQIPLTSIIEILTLIQQFEFIPPGCPTDLFLGRYDQVVSSQRVEDRFVGKDNINIHWLANSAHVLPLDGDIDNIIGCIKQNHSLRSKPMILS
ncbi:MAG: alpha/beta fold hydrolase [Tatlockia sp.]|nr:alpha/beta fold hydrolase [Tatlockia sp.]